MTIYVDVTEARTTTRLHPKLAKTAQQVVGLEQATGADILISIEPGTLPGNVNRAPGSFLLKKHVENGMLIQRKSGSDALSSIPHYHNLITRMRSANSRMAWLLVTGSIFRKPNSNKITCEGRDTDWGWNAWQASLDAWQILGGYVHMEPDDLQAAEWVIKWDEKLPILLQDLERGISEKPSTPKLGMIDPFPERVTLMAFPGCGDAISLRIMEKCGTLASALEWMSQPDSFGVSGVGEESLKNWRRWMGLQEGEVMARWLLGGPTVHADSDSKVERVDEGKLASEPKARPDFNGSNSIPKRPERETRANRYKDE